MLSVKVFLSIAVVVVWNSFSVQSDEKCNVTKWMSFMEKNCQKDDLKSRQKAELTKIQEHITTEKIAISCSLLQKSHKIIMGSTIFDESKFRYVDTGEKNENVKQNDVNEGQNVPHQVYQEKKLKKKKELKEKIEIKKDNSEINDTIFNQIKKEQKKINSESENLKHVNMQEKKDDQIFNTKEDDKILKEPLKDTKTAKNNKNQIKTNDNPVLTNFSQNNQILIENNEDNSTDMSSDMSNSQIGNNDTLIEIDKYIDSEQNEKTPGEENFAKKGKDVNKNIEIPPKESYEEKDNTEKQSNLLKMQNKENTNKRKIKEKKSKINKSKDVENVKLEIINENEEINHQDISIKNENKLHTEKLQTESVRQSKRLKPVIKNNKILDKQDHNKVEKEEKLNNIKKLKKVVDDIKNKNDKNNGIIVLNYQPDNNNLNMHKQLIKTDEIESDVLKYKENLKTHESEIDQNLDIMKNEEIKVIKMKDTKLNKNRVNIEDKGDNDKESKNNNLKKLDEISEKQNSNSDILTEEENETEIDENEIDKHVLMKPVENLIQSSKEKNNIVTSVDNVLEINEKNSNFVDEKENENQTEDSDNINFNETLNDDNNKEISANDKQTTSKIEKHIEKLKIENNKDNMNSHINNKTFIKISNNKEKKQKNDTFKPNDDNILRINEKDSENRKKDLVIDENIVIPRRKDDNKNNKESIKKSYKNETAIDKKNKNSRDKKMSNKLKKEHKNKSVESYVNEEKNHIKLKNDFKINEGQIIKNKIIQTKKNEIPPIKHINIPFEENLETKTVSNEKNDNYSDKEKKEEMEKEKKVKGAQHINLKQEIPREEEKIYENVNKNLKDINQNDQNMDRNKIESVESHAIKKKAPKKLKVKKLKQKMDLKKNKDQIIKEKHIQTKSNEILPIKPNNIHSEGNLDLLIVGNEQNVYSNKEEKENKENKNQAKTEKEGEKEKEEETEKEEEKEKEIKIAQNIHLKQELLRKDEEILENKNKNFNNIIKNDPNVEKYKTESEKSHLIKEKNPKKLKDKKHKVKIDLKKKKNQIVKEKHVQMKNNEILQVKPINIHFEKNSDVSKVVNEENNINSNKQEKENKEKEIKEIENENEKMEEAKEEENVKENKIKGVQNIDLKPDVLRENKEIHENENNNRKVINHNDNIVKENTIEQKARNPLKVLKENTENEHDVLFDKQSQLLNNQKSEQAQSNKNESTKKSNLENGNEKIQSNKFENNQKEQVIIKNEDFIKNEIHQNTENDENNFIKSKNKSIKTNKNKEKITKSIKTPGVIEKKILDINDEDKEKFIVNKSKENKNKFLKQNKIIKLNKNEIEIDEIPERTIKRNKDTYVKSTVANEFQKNDNEKTEKKIKKLDEKDSTMKIDQILNNSDKGENKNISENDVVHNNEGKKKEFDKENYKPMKLETKDFLNKKDNDKIQMFNESEDIFKSDNDLKNNDDIKENQIKKKNQNQNINPAENVNKDKNYEKDILTNFIKTSTNEESVEKLKTPTEKDILKSLENKNENLNTINDDQENTNKDNSENEDLKVYKNESPNNNDIPLDPNSRYNKNINNQKLQNESLIREKNDEIKVLITSISVDSDSHIVNDERVDLSSIKDNITKTKLDNKKRMEENPIEIQGKDITTNIKNKNTDSSCKIKQEIIMKKLEDYQNELETYKKTQKDQSNLLNTRLQNLEKKLKYISLVEQKNQKHENLIKNLKNKLRKVDSKLKRLFMLLSKIYSQLYPNILKKYNQLLREHNRVDGKDFKEEAMKVLNETVNEAMESFAEKTFKRVLKHLSVFPISSEMNLKSNIFQGYESEKCKFLKTVQIPICCANNTKTQSRKENLMELVKEGSVLTDCRQVENEQKIFTNVPFGDNNLKVRILCRNKSIVILKRISGFINFTRNWNDYKYGFGEQNNSFWIGLEVLYQLSRINDYKLIVELKDWENKSFKGVYEQFKVDSELQGYQLTIGNFHGDCGDGLGAHNNSKFSTIDVDNDRVEKKFGGSCSNRFRGGWWYYACYKSNPTGIYYDQGKVDIDRFDGISWKPLRPPTYSFQQIIMSIQRN